MTPQTLFEKLEFLKNEEQQSFIDSLKFGIKCGFVDKFSQGDERPCEPKDFVEIKKYKEVHIFYLVEIFKSLIETGYFNKQNFFSLDPHLLPLILVLCGENVSSEPWNTEKSVENCKIILNQILELLEYPNVSLLLQKNNKVIKNVLQIIRPKLLFNTWKCNPAAVSSYRWFLSFIIQPELSSFLPSVLPTALLLVDDYVNANRIIGIKCINHIVSNLTLAELQFHGHGDVIYNALLPLVRIRESEIVNVVMPCLVKLTSKMEVDFGKKNPTQWSKFDDILEIYLENMELEQMVNLRNSYMNNLLVIFNAVDYKVIRWTKRLFRIFKEYLKIAGNYSDKETTSVCLKVIEKFIEVTKRGSHLYARKMICIILMAFYNIIVENDSDILKENNSDLENESNSDIHKENEEKSIKLIKVMFDVLSESEKKEFYDELMEKLAENTNFCNHLKPIFDINIEK